MELNIEAIKAAARAPNDHPPPDPAAVLALIEELERTQRNRDMWKGQCERQADELRRIHVEQAGQVGFKP
jgi:hypothetical protein